MTINCASPFTNGSYEQRRWNATSILATIDATSTFLLKLTIGIMIIALSLAGYPAAAAEKHAAKAETKKTSIKSKKCWKRMILSDDVGGGNAPVCIAFEKVLNNTCITPEKLPCNWPLPSGEKRFKKVTWHPVDWRGYLMTLKDYGNDVNSIPQDLREKTWKRDEPRIRREFERGEKTLAVTTVDIDNNGTPEEVVRLGFVPCSVGSGFFVIQPKTRKYDKEFRYMLQKPNFSNCSEIMFYDGHSYIFAWDDAWKLLMVWQGFYFTGPLSMEQCRFKYQKGGKKK